MTKSTWSEEGDMGSKPKGSEQVEEVQQLRGNYHIDQSLNVDHLERAFAEVSLTEKYDCKKVVLDISAHQCLKKTSHESHSQSETSEGEHGPQLEEHQKKQEEEGTVHKHDKLVEDPKKNGDIKGDVSGQEKYDRGRLHDKNEEKCLSSILVSDEDDNEDESSDEDQGPLITVKLEEVKDKREAPYPKQGPNKTDSVHMPSSPVIPKVILLDSSAHQPQKESYQKDKSSPKISEELRYGSQKATKEKENVTVEKEDDVKKENKVGIVNREKKDGKFVSKSEEKGFPSIAEDEGCDEESSDEEDQVPLITVKLEDEVKDDTDEAYLERGPSKGGSVHLRYSPMTPKSHGLSMHGSHGLPLRPSSTVGGGFYPSAHMDDLETHTDPLTDYANTNSYGGLIGEHFPEISTPYMTPPHQAVQPTQVCSQALGRQNSIEEVLEVITRVDVGEVEADVGECERHYVDQILMDLRSLDGKEFGDLPWLNVTNSETFSGENQSPYPGGSRVKNPCVGKCNNGYKDIKPKTPLLSLPQQEIQRRMCETSLEQIFREMTSMVLNNRTALYCVEWDGETCLTRILKQSSDSENFYENIYARQEILKRIQMCCDMQVDIQSKQCSRCGQGNAEEFYTPLSVCNREGKCGLTIAVEKNHPIEVVNYLCSGIEECRKDLQRAFSQQARQIFAHNITSYPVFGKFLSIKK